MRALVRLVTVLLGLLVAVIGALAAIEGVWAAIGSGGTLLVPWTGLAQTLTTWTWQSGPAITAAIVLLVLGLILLFLGARASTKDIRLEDPAPNVVVTTAPRSLARLVGHRVREEDGVAAASVTASRKRVTVHATSQFRTVGELRSRLDGVVTEVVHDLPLKPQPAVSVSVAPAKEGR